MNRALLGGLIGFILVLASALTGYLVRDRITAGTPVPSAARAGPAAAARSRIDSSRT